ncbi:hypothetical protein Desde_1065 [Desulfitobacterium dehalogenans ATCC 51507]|uniref:Uncharacterized protein n=1 Tax=Desulfitobacterium dehalogenans (strain ATCC 51507 / DSM 9161 / JW/IU-DC1) TaxID=756499 RepID=I4A6B3_DESDJ|nr:hypothetical protein [Desulfitobacterium dehalogenans]AFL99497.1 hypothetical protein Desde_1065 [Desulfitobacterium dehalogenans ATCC 51507]
MGKQRNWTKEELDYLQDNWGAVSVETIAARLNRSIEAIKIKKDRLGLGAFLDSGEYVTFNQLLKALGITGGSGYLMTSWVKNRGFPIKYKKVLKNKFKVVYLKDFWKWAEKNRSMINWSKVEIGILGEEPPWVLTQRRTDFQSCVKIKTTPWTKGEDKHLHDLLKQFKYNYKELSTKLQRSEGAIQRRINDLALKERPIKADNQIKWTEDEYIQLGEMIKQRLSYEDMSDRLGKSAKAIRGKVYTMYLSENLDKVASIIGKGKWGDNRPDRKITLHNCLTSEERAQVKSGLTKIAVILREQICKHYEGSEYWQRGLCENWDDRCLAGKSTCDFCESFIRIKPQYCRRCGAEFYKRNKQDICDLCKVARKKQHQRKWMALYGEKRKKEVI